MGSAPLMGCSECYCGFEGCFHGSSEGVMWVLRL